jgi:uncharacterized protein
MLGAVAARAQPAVTHHPVQVRFDPARWGLTAEDLRLRFWVDGIAEKLATRDRALLKAAADTGDMVAAYLYAELHDPSHTSYNQPAVAMSYYRRAADAGVAAAQFRMGFHLDGGTPAETIEGIAWYRKAADQGHWAAMRYLASRYQTGGAGLKQDPAESVRLLRMAAESGSPAAMTWLGQNLEAGRGVARDVQQAAFWYDRAAVAGDADAMISLALMLFKGDVVPADPVRARALLQGAAKTSPLGMRNLALALESGDGGPRDLVAARYWYRRAAEHGNTNAMVRVAEMYARGEGGPVDATEAKRWSAAAARP